MGGEQGTSGGGGVHRVQPPHPPQQHSLTHSGPTLPPVRLQQNPNKAFIVSNKYSPHSPFALSHHRRTPCPSKQTTNLRRDARGLPQDLPPLQGPSTCVIKGTLDREQGQPPPSALPLCDCRPHLQWDGGSEGRRSLPLVLMKPNVRSVVSEILHCLNVKYKRSN